VQHASKSDAHKFKVMGVMVSELLNSHVAALHQSNEGSGNKEAEWQVGNGDHFGSWEHVVRLDQQQKPTVP